MMSRVLISQTIARPIRAYYKNLGLVFDDYFIVQKRLKGILPLPKYRKLTHGAKKRRMGRKLRRRQPIGQVHVANRMVTLTKLKRLGYLPTPNPFRCEFVYGGANG